MKISLTDSNTEHPPKDYQSEMGEGDGTANHSRLGWVSCIFFFLIAFSVLTPSLVFLKIAA